MHPSGYTTLSKIPYVKADLAIYCLVNGVSGYCMSVYVQAKDGISVLVRRWSVFQNTVTNEMSCHMTSLLEDIQHSHHHQKQTGHHKSTKEFYPFQVSHGRLDLVLHI